MKSKIIFVSVYPSEFGEEFRDSMEWELVYDDALNCWENRTTIKSSKSIELKII